MAANLHKLAFLVGLLIFLISSGCPNQAEDPEANSNNEVKDFILVASGDTQGWIMPCGCTSNQSGGLLRRGTYFNQLRKQNELFLVDVGGAADGDAPYQFEKFRAIVKGEEIMGVQAHNIGVAELVIGAEKLKKLRNSNSNKEIFISANVVDENHESVFDPIRSYNINNSQIHLIGVVSPRFKGEGLKVLAPREAILDALTDQKINDGWIVVLAYMNEEEIRELAASLPEAHAIIGGPTNQALHPEKVGQVLITSATNKGKFLAELTFRSKQKTIDARIVEMSPDFEDEEKQKQNLSRFRQILATKDFKASESGLANDDEWAVSSSHTVAGSDACYECHEEIYDEWKSTGHAHAWGRLVTENAHFDSYCQQCHTTGYGWSAGFISAKLSQSRVNVGCESCHGPSQQHVENSTVNTPFDAKGSCVNCHDHENSPHFNFDSYWEKIQHE